jgi:hypothetical protein
VAPLTRQRAVKAAGTVAAVTAAAAAIALVLGSGRSGGSHAAHAHATPSAAHSLEAHPVAGHFHPDGTALADCARAAFDQRCYEQAFGNLAYRAGPKVAMTRFAAAMAADPLVERGCHRMAHAIGSASLARYKNDVAKAFAAGNSTCWSGYYHGILERALVNVRGEDALVTVARKLCAARSVRVRLFLAYQCVHGLGHGLMIHTGLDMPASLRVCERLATTWDQTSCDGGVFMENFNTSYGVRSRYLRDRDLLYPCDAVAERHKLYCYLQVTDRILASSSGNWQLASRLCSKAERNWRATCFQSYGRSVSSEARGNPQSARRLCAAVPNRWRGDCNFGVARDLTSNDEGGARAANFCRVLPERSRAHCFYGIGTILGGIYVKPDDLAKECVRLTGRYAADCTMKRPSA